LYNKLQYKCNTYGKKILIVDESFTSRTCGVCWEINKMGGNKIYLCQFCGLEIDRDVTGSRNILIENHEYYNYNMLDIEKMLEIMNV